MGGDRLILVTAMNKIANLQVKIKSFAITYLTTVGSDEKWKKNDFLLQTRLLLQSL